MESFREGDKVKQRIVAHLGRKDLLGAHPEENPRWVAVDDISAPRGSTWVPVLVVQHLIEKLSLGAILDAGMETIRPGQDGLRSVEALPSETERFAGGERAHRKGRLRGVVGFVQLAAGPGALRNDFSFFRRAGAAELGQFANSRDGKPRNRQIAIRVVTMDGSPVAHRVFADNRLNQTTVLEVVKDLKQRFALNRVVFVGDRTMMTMGNVERPRQRRQGYLLGLERRARKDVFDFIEQGEGRTGSTLRWLLQPEIRQCCPRRGSARWRASKPV